MERQLKEGKNMKAPWSHELGYYNGMYKQLLYLILYIDVLQNDIY